MNKRAFFKSLVGASIGLIAGSGAKAAVVPKPKQQMYPENLVLSYNEYTNNRDLVRRFGVIYHVNGSPRVRPLTRDDEFLANMTEREKNAFLKIQKIDFPFPTRSYVVPNGAYGPDGVFNMHKFSGFENLSINERSYFYLGRPLSDSNSWAIVDGSPT